MKIKNRLLKRICAIVLAVALAFGAVPVGNFVQSVIAESNETTLKIAAISDAHYYPISYVSDCADYTTYVNGDPKLLEESGGILDSASQMVIADKPDVLLVSGDLTKDGEVKGHEEFAAKLQKIKEACPDTQIYVINGNHDINNTDAWTFASGQKVSVDSATPEKFSEIYEGFGYNAERRDTDKIKYYVNSEEHPDGRVVGGLSYAAQINESFVVLALDSGMYSVDSGNGYDHDEHITGGKIDSHLMKWATGIIEDARKEGKTVIGLMHHGLVPHFTGEEDLFSEYVVTDWENAATQLADAGLRYIFTGHMHANDVAEYTTVKGNHITDVETGSLVSCGSPVRSVELTKNVVSEEESFDISSESVKAVTYKDEKGQTVAIDDIVSYEMQKLYPETFLNNMLNGVVTPMLTQLAQSGDLKETLKGLLKGEDLDAVILDAAHSATAAGMNLNMGTVGTAVITYQNGAIHVKLSGVGGGLVGEETITDEEVLAIVNDVLNQIQTKYINDPSYVKQILDEVATEVSNFSLGVVMDDGTEATLYDLLLFVLTNHYNGHESAPEWVQESMKVLDQGEVIQKLVDKLVPSLCSKITPILQNLYVNFDLALDGSLIKSQLNSNYNNGQLLALMNGFGFSLETTVNDLIKEYMSPSFRTGMGQIVSEIVEGLVYDKTEDDVLGGNHRIIEYGGKMDANPQEASIANGLLPSEVSMTFGSDPQTAKAFKWYTGTSVDETCIRYSTSPDMQNAVTKEGTATVTVRPKTLMNLGLMASYTTQEKMCHEVTIENLAKDTTYYYQVGAEGKWSETASFTTASSDESRFSVIAVSDSQGMVASDYKTFEKTFQKAQSTVKNAEFTMNLGDMVDEGVNVDYWDYLTNNTAWRAQTMVPVSGNHEAKKAVEGVSGDTVSNQFNMNAILNGAADDSGVYYSFEYKNAVFVVLNTNDGAAVINSSAQQWASDCVIYGENAGSSITINQGSFESKNWNSAVVGNGTLTVNGGSKIAGCEVGNGAVGYINGGTFTEGTSNTQYTPLVIKGTAYMTAGAVTVSAETGKAVELAGTLHMRPKAASAVRIGTYTPYIGSVSTDNFMDVSAVFGANGGTNVDTQYDRMYAADSYAASFAGQTSLPASALDTTQDAMTLKAKAPAGTTYIFAKSQYYGNGRSVDVVTGNGSAYLYNNQRTVENYAVESLEIEDGAEYVLLQKDTDTRLGVTVKPDQAFNDGVIWTSDNNEQTQITDAVNGNVKSTAAGVAVITATAAAYPDVTDKITAITLDPGSLNGPASVIAGSDDNLYEMSLGEGLEGTGLSVRFAVDDTTVAEIDENTGVLTAKTAGKVTVTATAYYNGKELPVSRSIDVTVADLSLELKREPAEGGTVSADKTSYKWNDKGTITAVAADGYRFEGWKDASGQIISTEANYTTPELKADVSYTAVFAKLYHAAAAKGLEGGTVRTDTEWAAAGDKVAVTAEADAGYQLDNESLKVTYHVTEGGAEKEVQVDVAEDLTFTMPQADVVITAEFVKIPFNITIDPEITHGQVTVSGQSGENGQALIGDIITVTAVPEEGYLLKPDSVSYNGTAVPKDENGEYRFTMEADNVVVTAVFEINQPYADLKAEIEKAESIDTTGMTEDSVSVLQEALKKAKESLVPEITRETADKQIKNIQDACNGLTKVPDANLVMTATEGGTIVYQNISQYDYRGYVAPGTEVTLQAAPEEGAQFQYWQDTNTNRIISKAPEYTFIMGDYKEIKAVFYKPAAQQYQVTFLNSTGTVLWSGTVQAGGEAVPPVVPETTGYTFNRWDTDEYKNVTRDLTVTAVMDRTGGWYQVQTVHGTVNGVTSLMKQFDTSITLKADEAAEGEKFACWRNQATGAVVSYKAEVSLKVVEDAVLEAVYVNESTEVEETPVITFAYNTTIGRTVKVFAQKELPQNCKIIEWGVILKKADVTDPAELERGKQGVLTVRIARLNENSQIINLPFGGSGALETTSRGYVMYKDAEGNVRYVYSDNLVHAAVQ